MKTRLIHASNPDYAAAAAQQLRKGDLVAVPTETVYGLAGNALDESAVRKIFEAKGRPSFDPLIVHIDDPSWIEILTKTTITKNVKTLITRFWPGPLTILLPKGEIIPDSVTAGLPEVALRMPSNGVFRRIIQTAEIPLAAPSANRFGRISPTRAEHVMDELDGRIPLIIDDGSTSIGIESTIVRPHATWLEILRPGPVTTQMLETVLPVRSSESSEKIEAPGQMKSHYAPEKQVYLFDKEQIPTNNDDTGILCWGPVPKKLRCAAIYSLSEHHDYFEAAQRLFGLLRALDAHPDVKKIFIQILPKEGLGIAIMNRIERASTKSDL